MQLKQAGPDQTIEKCPYMFLTALHARVFRTCSLSSFFFDDSARLECPVQRVHVPDKHAAQPRDRVADHPKRSLMGLSGDRQLQMAPPV